MHCSCTLDLYTSRPWSSSRSPSAQRHTASENSPRLPVDTKKGQFKVQCFIAGKKTNIVKYNGIMQVVYYYRYLVMNPVPTGEPCTYW